MILQYKDLIKYQLKFVMTDGCFDPIHIGHIYYFKFAAQFNKPVFCNIEKDEYIRKIKKRPPLLPEKQRLEIIDSIKYISYVHLQKTSTSDVLKILRPIKYVKGADWKGSKLPKDEFKICKKLGIEILFLDKNLDSSTRIIDTFLSNNSYK